MSRDKPAMTYDKSTKRNFASWSLLTVILIIAATGLTVACVFSDPDTVALATNSDMLLPFSFARDVARHASAWHSFELSRSPSLLPDSLLLGVLLPIMGATRWTIVVFGMLQVLLFVLVGGWIASFLAARRLVTGCAAMLLVFASVVALRLGGQGAFVILGAFVPMDHFGPFLVAMVGGRLLASQLRSPGAATTCGLFSVAALVFLADQMLLVEFILPALGACLVAAAIRQATLTSVGVAVAPLLVGLLAGRLGFTLLCRAGLHFEHPPVIEAALVRRSIAAFAARLPGFACECPVGLAAGLGLPLLLFACYPRFTVYLRARADPAPGVREPLVLWCFAALGMAGSVGFTACLYINDGSVRYLVALWVWPLVFAAAILLLVPVPARWWAMPPALLLAGCLVLFTGRYGGSVALLNWDDPLAKCVRAERGRLGLHAGVADYWVARPLEFALDDAVQVDQVDSNGGAFLWGNDFGAYRHALADPSLRPEYDFVVMDRLDPVQIRSAYGKPDQVVPCAGTTLWIYRHVTALRAALYATDPARGDILVQR